MLDNSILIINFVVEVIRPCLYYLKKVMKFKSVGRGPHPSKQKNHVYYYLPSFGSLDFLGSRQTEKQVACPSSLQEGNERVPKLVLGGDSRPCASASSSASSSSRSSYS